MTETDSTEAAVAELVRDLVDGLSPSEADPSDALRRRFHEQGLLDLPFYEGEDVRGFYSWARTLAEAAKAPAAGHHLQSAGLIAPLLAGWGSPASDRLEVAIRAGESVALWLPNLRSPEDLQSSAHAPRRPEKLEGVFAELVGAADPTTVVVGVPDEDRRGVTFLSLPVDREGLSVDLRDSAGLGEEPELVCSGVEVSSDDVLGRVDAVGPSGPDATQFSRLEVLLSFELLGLMRTALAKSVDYALVRHQFGKAIGSFQALQHLLADMAVGVEVSTAILDAAALSVEGASTRARVDAGASKVVCGAAAVRVCELAIQVHGAIGFTSEAGLDELLRRAFKVSALLGDAEWHRQWLAVNHHAVTL